MHFAQLLDLKLRERITLKLRAKLSNPSFAEFALAFERELSLQQEALVDLLLKQLDLEAPPPPPEPEPLPGAKIQPPPEVLVRAEKLQRLALQSPSADDRNAAWTAFEKLWQKYHLPSNLGMTR